MGVYKMLVLNCQKMLEINCHFLLESTCRLQQHGFTTVQDFYTSFYTAQRATEAYQKECAKWEEAYEEKATLKAETMHDKIKRYQEKADRQNASQPYRDRDKGAR